MSTSVLRLLPLLFAGALLSACGEDDPDTAQTCAELSCEAENRSCDAGSDGADAACGACLDGFEEQGGACVESEPVDTSKTCADLGCGAENRSCSEGAAGVDASCGGCLEGFFDDAGSCTSWTVCDDAAGEQESVPPTPTSDRVCSTCEAGEYRDGEDCAELTECVGDEYESTAPTGVSDRACESRSTCAPGEEYASKADEELAHNENRSCLDLSAPCTGDDYESVAPGVANDRTCTLRTQCDAGEGQAEASLDFDQDRSCEPCAAGEFTVANNCIARRTTCDAGTGSSQDEDALAGDEDFTCTACSEGTFSGGSTLACQPHVVECDPGHGTITEPTTSQDRECAACTGDTFRPALSTAPCFRRSARLARTPLPEKGLRAWKYALRRVFSASPIEPLHTAFRSASAPQSRATQRNMEQQHSTMEPVHSNHKGIK